MDKLKGILSGFDTISLEEMESVKLMNRVDTKYVATLPELCLLLEKAKGEYRVQQIGDRQIMPYYTCYFDTPDCLMFTEHERGRSERQKVRLRIYEDSGTAFLEIKTKDNHGRTRKQRTRATQGYSLEAYDDFITGCTPFNAECLKRQIENHFYRITLVNNNKTERLTIDIDLRFHNITTQERCSLDQLVIIELKRDGRTVSPILSMLRDMRIHESGFSKYCLGMAFTNDSLRHNRIKPRIMKIKKLILGS